MILRTIIFFSTLFLSAGLLSKDVVKANIGESTKDVRIHYKKEVLTRALELTRDKYGDYEIQVKNHYMNTDRSIKQLSDGNTINVFFALTRNKLEELAEPVRIPVRRGLISYRLLMVHKDSLPKFEKVKTIEDLKRLRVGLDTGWATYDVMHHSNFNIVPVADYESMFNMLLSKRFDYLPRGVNEIFGELNRHSDNNMNMVIEPSIALKIPSATYVFVSKNAPRIKERLNLGISIMAKNGELEEVFDLFFKGNLDKAKLNERNIIEIENPFLPKKTPVDDETLWVDLEKYYKR